MSAGAVASHAKYKRRRTRSTYARGHSGSSIDIGLNVHQPNGAKFSFRAFMKCLFTSGFIPYARVYTNTHTSTHKYTQIHIHSCEYMQYTQKYTQIDRNTYKYIQLHTNTCLHVMLTYFTLLTLRMRFIPEARVHTNTDKCTRKHSNIYKYIQIHTNTY